VLKTIQTAKSLKPKIAVLLTCFNRQSKTLMCLEHLFNIAPNVDVYLVDDNSTDGTSEAVKTKFPKVQLIKGNGNLFWNRGMHLAWETAAKNEYDFFIWLNDDVELYPNCFDELFACSDIKNHLAIISGLIELKDTGEIIYGGTDNAKRLIHPNGELNPITNMNGNVVLVPKKVFKVLGNLDPVFHHDLGDVDYGLSANEKNIGVFSTRKSVAAGDRNDICRVRLNNANILKRFKRLYSPLGSNPRINFYFRRKHYGLMNAATYYFFLHFLNILPDYLNTLIFKQRYI
jgi:GT2 family glycosyltransferase